MTFRKKITDLLVESGVKENDVLAVVIAFVNSPSGEPMRDRMDDDVEGYPPMAFKVCWAGVQKVALEWIDQNKPDAWYRDVFADSVPGEQKTGE